MGYILQIMFSSYLISLSFAQSSLLGYTDHSQIHSTIVSAISNHDESTGSAVDPVSAALIIADKTDVRSLSDKTVMRVMTKSILAVQIWFIIWIHL